MPSIVVLTKGTTSPSDFNVPSSRFAVPLKEIVYEVKSRDGDSTTTLYECLWLTDQKDAHILGFSGHLTFLKRFFPKEHHDTNTIYWKGDSPLDFIENYFKAYKGRKATSADIEVIDKETYGFIKINEDIEMETLMSGLRFMMPPKEEGVESTIIYNYANLQVKKVQHRQPGRIARRDVDKWHPKVSSESSTTSTTSTQSTTSEPPKVRPRRSNGTYDSKKQKIRKVKVVDDDGFTTEKKVSA